MTLALPRFAAAKEVRHADNIVYDGLLPAFRLAAGELRCRHVMTQGSLESRPRLRLSILVDHLPGGTHLDRCKFASQAGFEGLEVIAGEDRDAMLRLYDAARQYGLCIHAVHANRTDRCYLGDRDPSVALVGALEAFSVAKMLQAESVVMAPASVTRDNSYVDCYARSQSVIRGELLPMAGELGIDLLVENIREIGFLQSPFEFSRYIDEFESPRVRALLDIGNMTHGEPQHWIPIVAHRIAKLHVKDYRQYLLPGQSNLWMYKRLGLGDLPWADLRAALADLEFGGWVTNAFPYSLRMLAFNKFVRLLSGRLSDPASRKGRALHDLQASVLRGSLREAARQVREKLAT